MINSRPSHLLCPLTCVRRDHLSRSYVVILPSSLTAVLSSALGYSPHLPVSVLVRATLSSPERFSRASLHALRQQNGLDPTAYRRQKPPRLIGGCASKGCTFRFNLKGRCGNINPLCIGYAFRPRLSFRLTLGGFTFPRKP